jgi:phosphohistidine phosphatase
MDVYLVRHGIAKDVGEDGITSDFDRILSDKGRSRMAEVALGLNRLGCVPGAFLSSPLIRARETAEIIRDELAHKAEIELADELAPCGSPARVAERLAACGAGSVLVVGHMPDLSILASYLLTKSQRADIAFKKGGTCCMSFVDGVVPGEGIMQWLLQPKPIRSFARR